MKEAMGPVWGLTIILLIGCSPDPEGTTETASTQAEPVMLAEEALVDEEATELTPEPVMDEQALEITKESIKFLQSLGSFSLKAEQIMDIVQDSGRKLQFSTRSEILVRRPDRFRVLVQVDDGRRAEIWYDGSSLSVQPTDSRFFGKTQAPGTIDETLQFLETSLETPMPLGDLINNDMSYLQDEVIEAIYVGEAMILETPVHHLAFSFELVDWQLWVRAEGDPLPIKLVVEYLGIEGIPQYTALFHHWELNPEAPDADFTFEPQEGAEQIRIVSTGPFQYERVED